MQARALVLAAAAIALVSPAAVGADLTTDATISTDEDGTLESGSEANGSFQLDTTENGTLDDGASDDTIEETNLSDDTNLTEDTEATLDDTDATLDDTTTSTEDPTLTEDSDGDQGDTSMIQPVTCRSSWTVPRAGFCRAPIACEDDAYATPDCSPDPACPAGSTAPTGCEGTENLRVLDPEARPVEVLLAHQPDCQPRWEEPSTMDCEPAAQCPDGGPGTPACEPTPRCTPTPAGVFTCRMPTGPGATASVDPAVQDELRQAIEEAMDDARDGLDHLRADYTTAKTSIETRYAEEKDALRETYRACLDGEVLDPSELEADTTLPEACLDQARTSLTKVRDLLGAQRDALVEDRRGQIEVNHAVTCARLEQRLTTILGTAGHGTTRLDELLWPRDLALCSGILLGTTDATGAALDELSHRTEANNP